jgi:hypothetical protein
LSEVLTRLSDTLGFELQLAGASDSIIDVDLLSDAPALVAKLSPLDNLIVAQARDPECPGRSRIVKVWMLPKAGQVAVRVPAIRVPHQLTEAERRQIQEDDDRYRKAHSLPPAPPHDDAQF